MKQSLQLRLGQHLTMTPQLQQAIRLLQLSTLDLQAEVQDVLESNLMLEAEDESGASEGGKVAEDGNGAEQEATIVPVDIPAELPVDSVWEDYYDGAPSGGFSGGGFGGEGLELEAQRSAVETLKDHLYWQLGLTNFTDVDKVIAATIIDATDDDGYLSVPLEDIQQAMTSAEREVGLDEVEAVLHQVQNFDPVGVVARDLRECLLLQIRQDSTKTPWRDVAYELVDEHIGLLGSRDYSQITRRMSIPMEDLQQALAYVQSLNPRPGGQVYSAPPEYVIPDVFVRKEKGAWQVELNPDAQPRLRINSKYAGLVRRADNSADNSCLKAHLQEARWFLKSLKSRSETLLKVAKCIVERQQAFLEYGEEAMKPMVLHDVAEAVDMHESTISRVTSQKYMHTPRGIFELKFFFSSHLTTKNGGECSSTAIRALLKKLIAAESYQRPLSDSKLAAILSDQGINVARRTVAKYREAMAIPSSTERKRLI
ncbi:MAG: RNA polymerase factor sigma-54 [Gammaproteobacteria bacterium]|nr:MAG: RNA polymerase factor sigma-54 [Gammaproteobacteria bacterium]